MKTKILTIVIFIFGVFSANARINPELLKKMKERTPLSGSRMDCQPSQAQYDLEINNVRARLLVGGDFWWDLQDGRYIVPKPAPGFPEVSAIFASGIWMGGVDPNGALKLAGVTYRTINAANNATDYYAGPLDENGQTNVDVCNDWDRHFIVKGENVRKHLINYKASIENNVPYPCETIPDDVKYWPARGNPFFGEEYDFSLPDQNMADFYDVNGDGMYNPCEGDYPIEILGGCEGEHVPDEIVFWIFNDNGGPHRLTQATAIQMEIQAQAFAFVAQNELNDMTFYRFKLVNKASDDIRDCYFGLWVDADLGCSEDDYIGCDVGRSMAYIYNEDAVDGSVGSACAGGVNTYGNDIPLLGIDMLRGPRAPKVFCGVDENGEKILCDPPHGSGEQDTLIELGMTSFTYQSRGVSYPPEAMQDPTVDFEFYNILKGQWKDGTAITFGNSGFDPTSIDTVRYAFTDPPNDENGWSMCTVNLPFDDRRTVQATGPLLLQPGAKNELIFGVIFVPNVNHPCPDISRLQCADDMAQALFDNCFSIVVGPDAPDMAGVRLDEQLILILSNDTSFLESNNAKEQFMQEDIKASDGVADPYYRFEGYKIYQLANANVSLNELDDIDKARRIRQVDIKNGVTDIYNWIPLENPDPQVSELIWVPERQVAGEDKGIQHSFNITRDEFANNHRMVNGKEYYFTVLAYAYNNYMQYDQSENIGQRTSYLEGRRNVKTYSFKPRSLGNVDVPTTYGQEVGVTRIEGIGTSFNSLDMAEGEIESMLDGSFDGEITYKAGKSPINPKVVDPLGIKDGKYRLEIIGDYNDSPSKLFIEDGAKWRLTNFTTGEIIASEHTIAEINEQVINEKGFSIQVNQVGHPGDGFDENNGAIAQVYEYVDNSEPNWWNAIPAFNGVEVIWNEGNSDFLFPFVDLEDDDDPNNALSTIDAGYFIPFKSARWISSNIPYITPAWKEFQGFAIAQNKLRLRDLNNVDLVFTSDKSKWSKCIVVESAVSDYLQNGLSTEDSREQFELRSGPSIDQNGNVIAGTGMSYFPGYAIDVETGERLNVFFGENSVFRDENDVIVSQTTGQTINSGGIGADMIWNPSTDLFLGEDPMDSSIGSYTNIVGGQHYIYVTRQEYDGCNALADQLGSGGLLNKINGVSFITWTAIPVPQQPLLSLAEGLIPNDLTVKLRVTNPFNKEIDLSDYTNPTKFNAVGGLPVYEFGFENVEITGMVSTEEPKILDDIIISPNPYYENSMYGQGPSGNMVRMTNLPKGSIVTIYTLEGRFVRRFSDEINSTFIESGLTKELNWNLSDNNGVRVSRGMYIFHVAVPYLGVQKSIKWIKI